LLLLTAFLLAVFIQNNYRLFSYSFGALRSLAPSFGDRSDSDSTAPAAQTTDIVRESAPKRMDAHHGADATAAAHREAADTLAAVSISDIRCRLSGDAATTVLVSLKLLFDDHDRRQEILLKREEIKVVVKKLFSGKLYTEVTAHSLPHEIRRAVNVLLSGRPVRRVEIQSIQTSG
jgi:flagellar basal body-associated protein FliL